MQTYIARFSSGLVLEVEAENDDWAHERAYEAFRKRAREFPPTVDYMGPGYSGVAELLESPQPKSERIA
jgi:hypothetical protein